MSSATSDGSGSTQPLPRFRNSGSARRSWTSDVTDRKAVAALFESAASLGPVVSVIHTAGVSPSMGDADYVTRTNAIGTLNVNEVFFDTAQEGAAIVNVASMAAHLLPEELIPTDKFPLALHDVTEFVDAMVDQCDIVPAEARPGFAYAVSKSFVKWYSASQCERFNAKGLRIVSVSPGSVDTEMGKLEEKAGAGAMVTNAAVPRWGRAEEMADLFAFCASDRAGYLTGTDILNDGGVVASMRERARSLAAAEPPGRRSRVSAPGRRGRVHLLGHERSRLIGRPVVLVGAVGGSVEPAREAHRVAGVALLNGLGRVQVADRDGGCALVDEVQEPVSGVPNNATAATCLAIAGGIGPVMSSGSDRPAGIASNVVYPATAAPCE